MLAEPLSTESDPAGAAAAPRYSFVVPIYGDHDLAEGFCEAFEEVLSRHLGVAELSEQVELIFVQDGGSESGTAVLREVCARRSFAKLVVLSRNFGQHIAVSAGYAQAQGNFVGQINVDQEEPPDQIPLLLREIETGEFDIVYSVRVERDAPRRVKYSSVAFNWILNKATGFEIPLHVGTLRVLRRNAVEKLNALPERSRYLQGLESWLGLRAAYVEIAHRRRTVGRSTYTMRSRLRLAFEAIVSFSDKPLRFVSLTGLGIALFGLLLAAFQAISYLMVDYRPGYSSTFVAIVGLGGVQIFVIGLASLYIGRILVETQHRPLYVVREMHGFANDHDARIAGESTWPSA